MSACALAVLLLYWPPPRPSRGFFWACALLASSLIPACLNAAWEDLGSSLNQRPDLPAYEQSLAVFQGVPYIAWTEYNDSPISRELHVKKFNGADWEQVGGNLLVVPTAYSFSPCLTSGGGVLYIGWFENFTQNDTYIKYFNGSDWQALGGPLTDGNAGAYSDPHLTMSGGILYASFLKNNGLADELYCSKWNGLDWELAGGALSLMHDTVSCHVLSSGGTSPWLAWTEKISGTFPLQVQRFNGSAWEQAGGILNCDSAQDADDPATVWDGGTPYVAWVESNGTADQIFVKKYSGSTWQPVGGSVNRNTLQNSAAPCLAVGSGTPYVAWQEYNGVCNQICLSWFNGNSWQPLGGSLNRSPSQAADTTKIFFDGGTLWLSWIEDDGASRKIWARKNILFMTPTPTPVPTPFVTIPLYDAGVQFSLLHPVARSNRSEPIRLQIQSQQSLRVWLEVYSLEGRKISSWDEWLVAGKSEVCWNGDQAGSGMYILRVRSLAQEAKFKILIVK